MAPLSTSARDASEDISEDKDGGVRKIIVSKGHGLKPLCGDRVTINYVGFLENGNHFTSNRNSGDNPFSFMIGKKEVMKAWERALPTMQKGEKCVLYCHHLYAYGTCGLPPLIRPNTNCLFEIELVSFEGQDLSKKKDGGIRKSVMESGYNCNDEFPYENAQCTISYECFIYKENEGEDNNNEDDHQDSTTDSSGTGLKRVENRCHMTLTLGELEGVTNGLDRAIRKMKSGEKARVLVSSKYAYGCKGCEGLKIPALSTLLYLVHLHDFVNTKQHWQMSREELLEAAVGEKLRGSCYFKEGKHYQARKRYSRALLLVESVHFLKAEVVAVEEDCGDVANKVHDQKNNEDLNKHYIVNNRNCSNVFKHEENNNLKIDNTGLKKVNNNINSTNYENNYSIGYEGTTGLSSCTSLESTKPNVSTSFSTSLDQHEKTSLLSTSTTVTTPFFKTRLTCAPTTTPTTTCTPTTTPTTTCAPTTIPTTTCAPTTTPTTTCAPTTTPTTISVQTSKPTTIASLRGHMRRKEDLRVLCLLNISMCHLRLHNFLRAFDAADRALQLKSGNLKGLYRRGMAHYNMANYTEAREDFRSLLIFEPSNSACLKQIRLCEKALERMEKKDKDVFKGMFQKFALFDIQKGWEEGAAGRRDVFSEVGQWENGMADGMMTLEQEMAAFGESMPNTDALHTASDED